MSYQPIGQQPYNRVQPVYDAICPYCKARLMTSIVLEDGNLTYTAASVLCLAGCWLGCCLIPFCMDSCKDIVHTCSNCRAPLGKYNRLC